MVFSRTNGNATACRVLWVTESSAWRRWCPLLTAAWRKTEAAMIWPRAKTFITMVTHLHSTATHLHPEAAVVSFYSNSTVVVLLCRKSGVAVLKLGVSVVPFKKEIRLRYVFILHCNRMEMEADTVGAPYQDPDWCSGLVLLLYSEKVAGSILDLSPFCVMFAHLPFGVL